MFNGDKSLSNLKNRATPSSIIQKPFDSPEERRMWWFCSETLYSNWSEGATTITKDQLSCNPGVTHPQPSSPLVPQSTYKITTTYHPQSAPPPTVVSLRRPHISRPNYMWGLVWYALVIGLGQLVIFLSYTSYSSGLEISPGSVLTPHSSVAIIDKFDAIGHYQVK